MVSIIIRVFLSIYAGLTLVAAYSQAKEEVTLPVYGFALGSFLLIASVILKGSKYGMVILIAGLILLHIAAIVQGLTTEFHLSHHVIRLFVSLVCIYFYSR